MYVIKGWLLKHSAHKTHRRNEKKYFRRKKLKKMPILKKIKIGSDTV